MTTTRPASGTGAWKTVPPAHLDERDLHAERSRQSTFERGVGLALVSGMLADVRHLRTLTTGLRWILSNDELAQVQQWLEHAHADILRAERIDTRAEDGRTE